jgi:hypothetical protein
MLFTVTVDLGTAGYFEFSTESLSELAEMAQMLGNSDVLDEDEECEEDEELINVPNNISKFFDEEEEYVYDENSDCYCWFDEEYDSWYWLDEDTGEWLLVEDEAKDEVEEE